MHKAYCFAVAAAAVTILIGAGGWMILSSPAGAAKAMSSSAHIDPLQMMKNTKNLPAAHYDDYSLVFN